MRDNEKNPLIVSREAPEQSEHTMPSYNEKQLYPILILILVTSISLVTSGIKVIPPGQVGLVTKFGQVSQLDPGLHIITPFVTEVETISTKSNMIQQKNTVPTKEGLAVSLELAVIYHVNETQAADLFVKVGLGYKDILIEPEAESSLRILTADSEAKALYTDSRHQIQTDLKALLQKKLGPRGIIIEDVLLNQITLPSLLLKAIETKAQAEQDALAMQFVIEKEKQEAERKAIEAKGIADFQNIVSEGISSELLQWKGIEATEKLAESQNSKMIFIGNSLEGLPVLLSNSPDISN